MKDSKPLKFIKHPILIPWYLRLWRYFDRPKFSDDALEEVEPFTIKMSKPIYDEKTDSYKFTITETYKGIKK